jgi:hypothetical protein
MFKNFNTIYLNIIYINYVLKNMRAIEWGLFGIFWTTNGLKDS